MMTGMYRNMGGNIPGGNFLRGTVEGGSLMGGNISLKVHKQIFLRTAFFHITPLVAISELRIWKKKIYIHKILNSK